MSRNRSLLRNLLSLCPNPFNRRTLPSTLRNQSHLGADRSRAAESKCKYVPQNAAGWTVSAEDGSDGGEWKTERKVLIITINLLTKGETAGCLLQQRREHRGVWDSLPITSCPAMLRLTPKPIANITQRASRAALWPWLESLPPTSLQSAQE